MSRLQQVTYGLKLGQVHNRYYVFVSGLWAYDRDHWLSDEWIFRYANKPCWFQDGFYMKYEIIVKCHYNDWELQNEDNHEHFFNFFCLWLKKLGTYENILQWQRWRPEIPLHHMAVVISCLGINRWQYSHSELDTTD